MHPSFEGINQSEQDKKDLLEYCKNPKGFLILSGTNGSGKSYASEAIYNENTRFRLPYKDDDLAIFVTQADLNFEWNDNFETQPYIIQKYKNTRLLVLDDIGTRKPSESFMDFLYAIVDYRWRNKSTKGTILTTNKTSREIRDMFGDPFLSRVASGMVKRWEHQDRRALEF